MQYIQTMSEAFPEAVQKDLGIKTSEKILLQISDLFLVHPMSQKYPETVPKVLEIKTSENDSCSVVWTFLKKDYDYSIGST